MQIVADWDSAPEWATCATYDRDGFYWWERMPKFDDSQCRFISEDEHGEIRHEYARHKGILEFHRPVNDA